MSRLATVLSSLRPVVRTGDYKDAVLAWLAADASIGLDDPAVVAMVEGEKENQPLEAMPMDLFLKYDTNGTGTLSFEQVYTFLAGEGFNVPTSLSWFDSDATGELTQAEFGRLYAILVRKNAKKKARALSFGLSIWCTTPRLALILSRAWCRYRRSPCNGLDNG
eukprot:COSAG05_NODE_1135_length_5760_cov_9.624448_6_plen_164_part_00